jgi:SAM-dependent methyltransferase
LVGPPLDTQKQFNAALVDHLNRNVATHREAQKAIATAIEVLRQQSDGLVQFETHLVRYLQTITLFVDTKDRAVEGKAQVVNAGLAAMTDDWLKRWESQSARDQRFKEQVAAIDDIRATASLAQQTAISLKREVERFIADARTDRPRHLVPDVPDVPDVPVVPDVPDLSAFQYVGFENEFRGSSEEIRRQLADYLPIFAGCQDVLDVGCGRGELLDLLREHGVNARGIDPNPAMVDVCRERGLDAMRADALGYLQSVPDSSIGGLIAIQVVEHLEPSYLLRLIETAFHKLRPGAPMVLETLNPACWVAFFESYIRDITHRWPLHPDTLRYLVQASGFSSVDVQFRSPVPHSDKLQQVSLPKAAGGAARDETLVELAEAVNAHAEKLNARLFTYLDYAVVARR